MTPRIQFALLLACGSLAASTHAACYPLFDSQDTLDVVLDVPMRELIRRAKKRPILDGQLRFVDATGGETAMDITITTRGNTRLEHCSFPPLSITLNSGQTDNTLFAGQDKLKIVTHCRSSRTYVRYLHQEYGIYRAYNVLSDHSMRVRWLSVTYRDSQGKRPEETQPAFFIESDTEVAERLDMITVKTKSIEPDQLDMAAMNIYELFQYMIANTDWSIKKAQETEDCCHNGKVIAKPGAENNWVVLPYDFDRAGIINAKYAIPNERLGIRSVRQRIYRGRCRHNDQLDATIELFNNRRLEVETAVTLPPLAERARKSALRYIDAFYTIINDPAELNKEIINVCLPG